MATTANGHRSICKVRPKLQFEEQPQSRLRFRYESENRKGLIYGVHRTKKKPSYAKIRLLGYYGNVSVFIVAFLVTANEPYMAHPHKLIETDRRIKNPTGVVKRFMNTSTMTLTLDNIGIQCVKIRADEIAKSFELRRTENLNQIPIVDDANFDFGSVRICVQGYIKVADSKLLPLKAIFSDPIIDTKTFPKLTITRLSHCSVGVEAKEEIALLCEKIPKNTKTEFADSSGWREEKKMNEIYNRVAATVNTPVYCNPNIGKSVIASVRLITPNKDTYSSPVPFKFIPRKTEYLRTRRFRDDPNNFNINWTEEVNINSDEMPILDLPFKYFSEEEIRSLAQELAEKVWTNQ